MWKKLLNINPELSAPDTWIVFSDDDDLWHPDRLATYAEGVGAAQCDITDVRAPHYVDGTEEDDGKIMVASDVDRLLDLKTLKVVLSSAGIFMKTGKKTGAGNYVDHCVRGKVFATFLEGANDFMLQNPMCDVMLQRHITTYNGLTGKHYILTEAPWMYFWRRHAGSACVRLYTQQKHSLHSIIHYQMSRLNNWEQSISHICTQTDLTRAQAVRYAREFTNNLPLAIQMAIGRKT